MIAYWIVFSVAIKTLSLISGLVPLHNACSYGHYEVAELLVRHGASVNVADLWKFTPLHEAAAKGKYEICKLLLKVCDLAFLNVFLNICFVFVEGRIQTYLHCELQLSVDCVMSVCLQRIFRMVAFSSSFIRLAQHGQLMLLTK